jgi:hypothetical protein
VEIYPRESTSYIALTYIEDSLHPAIPALVDLGRDRSLDHLPQQIALLVDPHERPAVDITLDFPRAAETERKAISYQKFPANRSAQKGFHAQKGRVFTGFADGALRTYQFQVDTCVGRV